MSDEDLLPFNDVPNVLDSEFEVLSLSIWDAEVLKRARGMLSLDDFYSPIYREIWAAMVAMEDRQTPVTPLTVIQQFTKRGGAFTDAITNMSTNRLGDARGLDYHCAKIEEATIARDLQSTLIQFNQRAGADWSAGDLRIGASSVADELVETLRVVQGMRPANRHHEIDVLDLVRREIGVDDWVIEGLIAKGERMLLTAAEGWGKSTLFRQMAACIAGGVHPFTLEVMQPKRALVIDAENPSTVNTVEWGKMIDLLATMGQAGRVPDRGQLIIEEIGPCNLLEPKQAARVLDLVDRVRPDVIFVGPLYQLFEADPNDEAPAKILARVLDKARMMNNSALIVEAHTPHTDHIEILRPFGASLWKRWPEFGFCLHDDGTTKGLKGDELNRAMAMRESYFTAWRGSRSAGRAWPGHLSAGRVLPWEVVRQFRQAQEPPQDLDEPPPPREPEPDLFNQVINEVPAGGWLNERTGEWMPN